MPKSPTSPTATCRWTGKTWMGVAKTTNTGHDWQLVWKESTDAASNVHDAWITPRFGITWGENPLNITVADQDPEP